MLITPLTVAGFVNHQSVVLHPVLLQIAGKNYLIDCGYAETFDALQLQLKAVGVSVAWLDGILISHDDIDHLGALHPLKQLNPGLKVYCSSIEQESVAGHIKSERLLQAEASLPHLPVEHQAWATGFIKQLQAIRRFLVDAAFEPGDLFEQELQVVHTPGHTAGHLSFFHPAEGTLVVSDAFVIEENGELNIANPAFTLDLPAAIASVEKIKNLHPKKLICYHGGVMDKGVDRQLMLLINKYKGSRQ